jgi:hypothetical protein
VLQPGQPQIKGAPKPAAKSVEKKPAVSTEQKSFAAPAAAAPASAPASGDGKVLVVNKDYNFAVLNMGSKDGVTIGNVFSIYHAGKYVGDVKVEKVHDSMAAAGFLAAGMRDKIAEGDKAVLKSK